MGDHLVKVGHGAGQADFQGMVIDRFDTQGGVFHLAFEHGIDVFECHQAHVPGIGRGQLRVYGATPGVDEVVRSDRLAVGPFGVITQVEGPGLVVVGFPALGDARYDVAFRVGVQQAFKEVANNVRAIDVFNDLRVQGGGLVQCAVSEYLLIGQLFTVTGWVSSASTGVPASDAETSAAASVLCRVFMINPLMNHSIF